ncbi:PH domain-containing protein [Pseudonocardia phyllosphaerae]|uniref:PH domain-containing protein n=1 Tax=Pseudonocardia phyllosphaerae TaxID=3390502 RepID=UPI00397AD155
MSDHPERRSWSTPGGVVAALWVLAVLALGWLVLLVARGADPTGALLAGVAAVGLGLYAASGTKARPRLEAGPEGIVVRRLTWTRHVPWSRVDDVRVLRMRRFGRESSVLELDLRDVDDSERLVVLGRPELGSDPEDVAEELELLRPLR